MLALRFPAGPKRTQLPEHVDMAIRMHDDLEKARGLLHDALIGGPLEHAAREHKLRISLWRDTIATHSRPWLWGGRAACGFCFSALSA